MSWFRIAIRDTHSMHEIFDYHEIGAWHYQKLLTQKV